MKCFLSGKISEKKTAQCVWHDVWNKPGNLPKQSACHFVLDICNGSLQEGDLKMTELELQKSKVKQLIYSQDIDWELHLQSFFCSVIYGMLSNVPNLQVKKTGTKLGVSKPHHLLQGWYLREYIFCTFVKGKGT